VPSPHFSPALWEQALSVLDIAHREMAQEVLRIVRDEFSARAYQRHSAAEHSSDRQTIVKHPQTGKNCLVISVAPDRVRSGAFALRLDFFDKTEAVVVPFGEPFRAPRTQWTEKGERRVFVPIRTAVQDLRTFIERVVRAAA
jgi:hypothetical protein